MEGKWLRFGFEFVSLCLFSRRIITTSCAFCLNLILLALNTKLWIIIDVLLLLEIFFLVGSRILHHILVLFLLYYYWLPYYLSLTLYNIPYPILIIQSVKARAIPCPHHPPTRGDNPVSVAQGSTATPGATEQLLPPDRVFKRIIYIYIYILLHFCYMKIYINKWIKKSLVKGETILKQ